MLKRGVATFGLDSGKVPRWLFERMVKLSKEIVFLIVQEYGPEEFVERIADPVWFQALGTVLAFDWNASGLTTTLTAALKEAIRGNEKELGLFIWGGKGKTSRKTPQEIEEAGTKLLINPKNVNHLIYVSRIVAKVDSGLIQDGYQLYHHTLFFSKNGKWTVVQQGMNTFRRKARRYHWFSDNIKEFTISPHKAIISKAIEPIVINLTAKESLSNREVVLEIIRNSNLSSLKRDFLLLEKHQDKLIKTLRAKLANQQLVFSSLSEREFFSHPVLKENFSKSKYLEKIFAKLYEKRPKNYQDFILTEGVGPKTIRAISLVAELIYNAPISYQDPARYAFAHGGKDKIPYPVDKATYDQTIEFFSKIIKKTKIPLSEKRNITDRLFRSFS